MELLSSSCAPTESPLKELNIGFAPIVLKKSFFAMNENSQDRWCVSLAAT